MPSTACWRAGSISSRLLGQYLDPIADKLLLSSAFLVLSFTKQIPWKYTVLVFSRDLCIMLITAVLYITTSIRDFRPSIFGKLNTAAQIGAIFFVLSWRIVPAPWVGIASKVFLLATMIFTCISGFHYILVIGQKLHTNGQSGPPATRSH